MIKKKIENGKRLQDEISKSFCNALDYSEAYKKLVSSIPSINKKLIQVTQLTPFLYLSISFIHSILDLLGVTFPNLGQNIPDSLQLLVDFRQKIRTLAKQRKDQAYLSLCDEIRNVILPSNGWILKDLTNGQSLIEKKEKA